MALTLTPGQFSKRAEYYYQLAQFTAAGIGLIGALEQLSRQPLDRSYREPTRLLLEQLAHGYTFTESLRRLDQWLPEFDLALLQAGEESGRLDASLHLLANYYQDRARIARQVIADLAYPVMLFHMAIFIFPFANFFLTGNLLAYLSQTLGILLPIYALVAAIIYAGQSRHSEKWRAWLESFLHRVPLLGTARRYLALARLAAALEALLSAGVSIIGAWELAAAASGSPALRRAALAWRPLLDAGQTTAEVVSASGEFPELFVGQYASGEISGKLEENLRRLHQYYQDEGSRKLRALASWTPRAIYMIIVLLIAYRVVTFWSGYFKQIGEAGGF